MNWLNRSLLRLKEGLTNEKIEDFKKGEIDEDEFWIEALGIKLLNRFLAVQDKSGKYTKPNDSENIKIILSQKGISS